MEINRYTTNLKKFFAITLVAVLLLATPGATGWSDVLGDSNNSTTVQTIGGGSGVSIVYTSQKSPSENYRPLINTRVGSSFTIQTVDALTRLAYMFGPVNNNSSQNGTAAGLAQLQAIGAAASHEVTPYLSTVYNSGTAVLTPINLYADGTMGSIAKDSLNAAENILTGGIPLTSSVANMVGAGSGNKTASPGVATTTQSPGQEPAPAQDSILQIKCMLYGSSADSACSAPSNDTANGQNSAGAQQPQPGIHDLNQAQIDQAQGTEVDLGVEEKKMDYFLGKNEEQIQDLRVQIAKAEAQAANPATGIMSALGPVQSPKDLQASLQKLNKELSDALVKENDLMNKRDEIRGNEKIVSDWLDQAKSAISQVDGDSGGYSLKDKLAISQAIDSKFQKWKIDTQLPHKLTLTKSANGGILGSLPSWAKDPWNIAAAAAVISGTIAVAVLAAPVLAGAVTLGAAAMWVGGFSVAGATAGYGIGSMLHGYDKTMAVQTNDTSLAQNSKYVSGKAAVTGAQDAYSESKKNALQRSINAYQDGRYLTQFKKNLQAESDGKKLLGNLQKVLAGLQGLNGDPNWRSKIPGILALMGDDKFAKQASKAIGGMTLDQAVSKVLAYSAHNAAVSFHNELSGISSWTKQNLSDISDAQTATKTAQGNYLAAVFGTTNPNAAPTSTSLYAQAQNGDAIAGAILRQNGVPAFDIDSGNLLSPSTVAGKIMSDAEDSTWTDHVKAEQNTFVYRVQQDNALGSALRNSDGSSKGILDTTTGVFWYGVHTTVSTLTDLPGQVAVGGVAALGGTILNAFGATDMGTRLQTDGLAQMGNSMTMQSMGGSGTGMVEWANGLSNANLLPNYDSNGNASLNLSNGALSQILQNDRQHALNSGEFTDYYSLLGQLNVRKDVGWLGTDALNAYNQGNYGKAFEYGLTALAVGGTQTVADVVSLGPLMTGMSAWKIAALPETASVGEQALMYTQAGAKWTVSNLLGFQFSYSVANDINNVINGVTAMNSGTALDQSLGAEMIGSGAADFASTSVGMAGVAGMHAAESNYQQAGENASAGQATWAGLKAFGSGLVTEPIKLGIQGVATLLGGPIGAVGSTAALAWLPANSQNDANQSNAIQRALSQLGKSADPDSFLAVTTTKAIQNRIANLFGSSGLSFSDAMDLLSGQTSKLDLGPQGILAKVGQFLSGATYNGGTTVDLSNPIVKQALQNALDTMAANASETTDNTDVLTWLHNQVNTIAQRATAAFNAMNFNFGSERGSLQLGGGDSVATETKPSDESNLRNNSPNEETSSPSEPSTTQRQTSPNPAEVLGQLQQKARDAADEMNLDPTDQTALKNYQNAVGTLKQAAEVLLNPQYADLVRAAAGETGAQPQVLNLLGVTSETDKALADLRTQLGQINTELGAHLTLADANSKLQAQETALAKGNDVDPLTLQEFKANVLAAQARLEAARNGADHEMALQASLRANQAFAELARAKSTASDQQASTLENEATLLHQQAEAGDEVDPGLHAQANAKQNAADLARTVAAQHLADASYYDAQTGLSKTQLEQAGPSQMDAARQKVDVAQAGLAKAQADTGVVSAQILDEAAQAKLTTAQNSKDDSTVATAQANKAYTETVLQATQARQRAAAGLQVLADPSATSDAKSQAEKTIIQGQQETSSASQKAQILKQQITAFENDAQMKNQVSPKQKILGQVENIQGQVLAILDGAQKEGRAPTATELATMESLEQKAHALTNGQPVSSDEEAAQKIATRATQIQESQALKPSETESAAIEQPDPAAIEANLAEMQGRLSEDLNQTLQTARDNARIAELAVKAFNSVDPTSIFSRTFNSLQQITASLGATVASGLGIEVNSNVQATPTTGAESLTFSERMEAIQLQKNGIDYGRAYSQAYEAQVQDLYRQLVESGKREGQDTRLLARKMVDIMSKSGEWSPDSGNPIRLRVASDEGKGIAENVGIQNRATVERLIRGMTDDQFDQFAQSRGMAGVGRDVVIAKVNSDSASRARDSGQEEAVSYILQGDNAAIHMSVGGGKTIVIQNTVKARAEAFGKIDTDIILQNSDERTKFETDDLLKSLTTDPSQKSFENVVQKLVDGMGSAFKGTKTTVKVYVMDKIAGDLRSVIPDVQAQAIKDFRTAMSDEMGIRLWTAESLGHLTTSSLNPEVDSQVSQILQEARNRGQRLVISDEGDVLLSNPVQYILSGKSEAIGKNGIAYSRIYDSVSGLIKPGEGLIQRVEWEPGKSLGQKFNELAAQGKMVYMVDADGQVYVSGAAVAELQSRGVWQRGEFERVVQAIDSKDDYTIARDAEGHQVLAPIDPNEGRPQADRILQDPLLAIAVVRAKGYSEESAIDFVRKSETSLSSSGGQLFIGKSQTVLLSGTMEGVSAMADAYGVPVQKFGEDKNVFTADRGASDAFMADKSGSYQRLQIIGRDSKEELAQTVARKMIDNHETKKDANGNSWRQLFISQDADVRNRVIEILTEQGYSVQRFDETITHQDQIDAAVGNNPKIKAADFVVGAMASAGRGKDYQGNVDLIDDWTNKRESDGTQSLGRVDRGPGRQFTRTIVVLNSWADKAVQDVYSFGIRQGLLQAGETRTDSTVLQKSLNRYNDVDGNPNGLAILTNHNSPEGLSLDQKVRLAAWAKEMSASSRGLESNSLSFIRDMRLENPLMKLARQYPTDSPVYKALQETVGKMLNRDFYSPQARSEVDDALTGTARMQRALDNLRQEAVKTLQDLQGRLVGVDGQDADVLRQVVDLMRQNWESLQLNVPTEAGDPSQRNIVNAPGLQEMADAAMRSGLMLSPSTGGREPSTAMMMMDQAASKTSSGGHVEDSELAKIQNAAVGEVQYRQEKGLPISGRLVAVAAAATPGILRSAVLGNVSQAPGNQANTFLSSDLAKQRASSLAAQQSVGAFWATYQQTYRQTRSTGGSLFNAVKTGFGQAISLQFNASLPPLVGLQTSANAYIQAEMSLAKQGMQDVGLANLRDIHFQNLAALATKQGTNLNQVSQIIQNAKATIPTTVDKTTAQKINDALDRVLALAVDAPKSSIDAGDGFKIVWTKSDGQSVAAVYVDRMSVSAGLRLIGLVNQSQTIGTPIEIHLPEGLSDRAQAIRALADQATNVEGSRAEVSVIQNTGIQNLTAVVKMALRHPIAWMTKQSNASDSTSGPVYELERAVTDIERLNKLEQVAAAAPHLGENAPDAKALDDALKAQQQKVEGSLSRLRVVATQMRQALELGLMHGGGLNEDVKSLLNTLADSSKSNEDSRSAIESYLKGVTESAHSRMLGPDGLSSRFHAVELRQEATPLAMMHGKLANALKGIPQASAVLSRLIPAQAAQEGRRLRSISTEAQEAYESLPTELARYHQDLIDVITAEDVRLAHARHNPQAGSLGNRQTVMTQRGAALNTVRNQVNQAFSQVPSEYIGGIDQLIQKESAQGSPLVIVTPDNLDYVELSNLRSHFENDTVKLITSSTYQDFKKKKDQETNQARAEALQDLLPKSQTAPAATTASWSEGSEAPEQRSMLMRAASLLGVGAIAVAVYHSLVLHGAMPDIAMLIQPSQTDPAQIVNAGFSSPVIFGGFLVLRYWNKVRTTHEELSSNARNLGRILTNA